MRDLEKRPLGLSSMLARLKRRLFPPGEISPDRIEERNGRLKRRDEVDRLVGSRQNIQSIER